MVGGVGSGSDSSPCISCSAVRTISNLQHIADMPEKGIISQQCDKFIVIPRCFSYNVV